MKVRAKAKGFDGKIRNIGEEFEFEGTEDQVGSWMEVLEAPKKKRTRKKSEPKKEDSAGNSEAPKESEE